MITIYLDLQTPCYNSIRRIGLTLFNRYYFKSAPIKQNGRIERIFNYFGIYAEY